MMRYLGDGNMSECSAAQLLNLPRDIDVVMLGSSRIRRGLSPAQIVTASNGKINTVFNLGRPGREMVRSYIILRDLVSSGIVPNVAVVEVDADNLRGVANRDWKWSGRNAVWLTYRDIFRHNAEFEGKFRNDVQAIATKITQSLVLNISGASLKTLPNLKKAPRDVCFETRFDVATTGKEKKKARKKIRLVRRIGNLDAQFDNHFQFRASLYNNIELHYLKKIRALAKKVGIPLIVIRPFGYMDPPLSESVVEEIRKLVPEFSNPPAAFVRDNNMLFMDGAHFSPEGREQFSSWLATQILAVYPQQ